jgi:hypothetical protein
MHTCLNLLTDLWMLLSLLSFSLLALPSPIKAKALPSTVSSSFTSIVRCLPLPTLASIIQSARLLMLSSPSHLSNTITSTAAPIRTARTRCSPLPHPSSRETAQSSSSPSTIRRSKSITLDSSIWATLTAFWDLLETVVSRPTDFSLGDQTKRASVSHAAQARV